MLARQYLVDLFRAGQDTDEAVESAIAHYVAHGLDDADSVRSEFERTRTLLWLQQASFPAIECPDIPLAAEERAHFIFENVPLINRQVVDQRVITDGSAFTLYDQGLAVTFGGSESRVVQRRADVTVDIGRLILTSERLIYVASCTAFDSPWRRMAEVTYANNEIRCIVFGDSGMGTRLRLGCDDPEYICTACNALWRRSRG